MTDEPTLPILVNREVRIGRDDRPLRRDPRLVRVRRGAYAPRGPRDDDEQYDLRIHAVLGTRRAPIVLSHFSAARVWRMPIVNRWPTTVHATAHPSSRRRSKNGVVIHRAELPDSELVELDGVLVTSRLRTLLDLAAIAPMRDAVAALDHELRLGNVDRTALDEAAGRLDGVRGRVPARRAVAFASPLAGSVGESFSRVLLHELGFPAPELQHRFETAGGVRFADFWWERHRLVGEFDGRIKYSDDPERAIWDEKLRENELQEIGERLVRWTWADLVAVTPFIRRLEAAGPRRALAPGYSARSGQ